MSLECEKMSYEHREEIEAFECVINGTPYLLSFDIGTYGCGEPCNPMEDWEHMYLKFLKGDGTGCYRTEITEEIGSIEEGKQRFHEAKKEIENGKFPSLKQMSQW